MCSGLRAKLQQAQQIAEQKLVKELQDEVDRKLALQAKRDEKIRAIEASRALRETRRRDMIKQFEKWSVTVGTKRDEHLSAIENAFFDGERARLTSIAVRHAAVLRFYERAWLLLDADVDGAVGDSDLVASLQAMDCETTQQQAVAMMRKAGLSRQDLQGEGKRVEVVANPARNGTPALGYIINLRYADGRNFQFGKDPSDKSAAE
jgi:hypothetical protein